MTAPTVLRERIEALIRSYDRRTLTRRKLVRKLAECMEVERR